MGFQENTIKEKQNSKLRKFISGFIADTLAFSAALLTVIVILTVIYMIKRSVKIENISS